jgi:V/A-type H+-transporting ATPase subunit I
LAYVQGYCPVDALDTLQRTAHEQKWGILVQEPTSTEEVPTYIKNSPWIRIIAPVLRFMGTTPGYKEFDVSFWFLLSLTLFFAMLVGDGGYGLLFLAVAVIVRWKSNRLTGETFALICVFSGATVVWGLLTGTWFGVESLARLPVLRDAVIPGLNSYAENDAFMIQLCFVIGALHLSLAHLLRGVRFLSSVRLFGEAGWIILIWVLYFLAGYFVLGEPLPKSTPYLMGAGILTAGIFSGRGGSFFRSALLGIADLPFAFIRSFSDMVSYIRLFAVGYATVVVAVSFNEMAGGVASDSWAGVIGAGAVLLFGHVLNMLLALMAVLVHGIRLNVLEFSTHLEMGWTGIPYRPFRSRKKTIENSKMRRNGS